MFKQKCSFSCNVDPFSGQTVFKGDFVFSPVPAQIPIFVMLCAFYQRHKRTFFPQTDSVDEDALLSPFKLSNTNSVLQFLWKCHFFLKIHFFPTHPKCSGHFLQFSLFGFSSFRLSYSTMKEGENKNTISFQKPHFGTLKNLGKHYFGTPYTLSVILNWGKSARNILDHWRNTWTIDSKTPKSWTRYWLYSIYLYERERVKNMFGDLDHKEICKTADLPFFPIPTFLCCWVHLPGGNSFWVNFCHMHTR